MTSAAGLESAGATPRSPGRRSGDRGAGVRGTEGRGTGDRGTGGRGPGRRAGRRKIAVLEAACRVIAERGADATRFADVAAESGVPVSTLQYYFGSREDLLVAAFRHASSAEIAALEADVAAISDPWQQLEAIIARSLTGYQPDTPEGGRLWIESWHFGIRDAEMRADALRDNTAWRQLVAEVVRRGIERGTFGSEYAPEKVAVLTIAATDGMGIPLSLADPEITPASAAQDVMAALRDMLAPDRLPPTAGGETRGSPR